MIKNLIKISLLFLFFSHLTYAQMTIDQLVDQTGIEAGQIEVRDLSNWSKIEKVLVQQGVIEEDLVRRAFPEVEFVFVRSSANALAHGDDAQAFIGGCNASFIKQAESLLWVQRTAAGVESCVDIPKIAQGEVILTNMQKMDSPVIAEHAIAMMMSLARGLPKFARDMDEGSWNRNTETRNSMTSIVGKKLLVVGLGGIGTEIARFGAALGMDVSAIRNSRRSGPDFVRYVGLSDEMPTLAAESDVIISALPLTESTTAIYDKSFFDSLKSDAVFINVGRGKSVVTEDLYQSLKNGHLAGVGLDVTDPEPLPSSHPLWDLDNVIITPHVSSSGSNRERRAVLIMENLRRLINGNSLMNEVNPERGY